MFERTMMLLGLALVSVGCGDDAPKKSSSVLDVNSSNSATNSTNNANSTEPINSSNNANSVNNTNALNNTNSVNNSNALNNTNSVNNTNSSNNEVVAAKCSKFCDTLVGSCVSESCDLDSQGESSRLMSYEQCMGISGDIRNSCVNLYSRDQAFVSEVENAQSWTCDSEAPSFFRCENWGFEACGCPLPVLGSACNADDDCQGGLLTPLCAQGADNPGGQCLAGGCLVPEEGSSEGTIFFGDATGCGERAACYVLSQGTICLQTCETNLDCDRGVQPGSSGDGYSCSLVALVDQMPFGVCEAACEIGEACSFSSGGIGVCTNERRCAVDCSNGESCPTDFSCTGTGPNNEDYCELNL